MRSKDLTWPLRLMCAVSALAVAGLTAAGPAYAAEAKLDIVDPWMRALPNHLPAAGYFTIMNSGNGPAELVGASSVACGSLMLHKSESNGGMEKMVMVPSIVIPPGGRVTFAPGGYHLMCMQPSTMVAPGNQVPVVLHFKNGAVVSAAFTVRNAEGK